jgi:hypothetical protein
MNPQYPRLCQRHHGAPARRGALQPLLRQGVRSAFVFTGRGRVGDDLSTADSRPARRGGGDPAAAGGLSSRAA